MHLQAREWLLLQQLAAEVAGACKWLVLMRTHGAPELGGRRGDGCNELWDYLFMVVMQMTGGCIAADGLQTGRRCAVMCTRATGVQTWSINHAASAKHDYTMHEHQSHSGGHTKLASMPLRPPVASRTETAQLHGAGTHAPWVRHTPCKERRDSSLRTLVLQSCCARLEGTRAPQCSHPSCPGGPGSPATEQPPASTLHIMVVAV